MAFSFIASGVSAQEKTTPAVHQVGINFSSLNSFGLDYKTGSEKTLLRLSLLSLNIGKNAEWGRPEDSLDYKTQNFGAGFRLGFEKQVPVVERLDFIWGLEAGCNFNYNKQKAKSKYNDFEKTEWYLTPLINLVIGVTYTIADHLVIGAEITPGIQYSYGKLKNVTDIQTYENTTSSFGFGFSNNSAALSLAYRFGK
jgi:hypothetical protein